MSAFEFKECLVRNTDIKATAILKARVIALCAHLLSMHVYSIVFKTCNFSYVWAWLVSLFLNINGDILSVCLPVYSFKYSFSLNQIFCAE